MGFLARYRLSVLVVCAAVASTAAVFAYARPAYHPRYESEMFDMTHERHYALADVRAAFASQGLRLRFSTRIGDRVHGVTTLATSRPPWPAGALVVSVAGPRATGSWGPKLDRYNERFGNVDVRYDGADEDLLGRVTAAVETLR